MRPKLLACALTVFLLALAAPAWAAGETFTVTNLDSSGPGSMSDAIDKATAAGANNTVKFAPGLSGTIENAYFTLYRPINIIGPGSSKLTLAHGGFDSAAVSDQPWVFSGFTITGSDTAFNISAPQITLTDVVVADSTPDTSLLYLRAPTIVIDRCVFRDNTADGYYVSLLYVSAEHLTVRDTQFSRNTMYRGIDALTNVLLERVSYTDNTDTRSLVVAETTIRQSTFGGNEAAEATFDARDRTLTLEGVTLVSSQTAPLFRRATVKLRNTIIQSGASPACVQSTDPWEEPAVFTSLGNNIVDDATCALTGPGDLQSTDARLSPTLALNGGTTLSYAPTSCSPAINAGNSTTADTTDQAGKPRVKFGAIDIGALELQTQPAPVITTQPTATQTLGFGATFSVKVTACLTGHTYQWSKNNVAIAGATAATYAKVVADGDAGSYTVAVTRNALTTKSNAAVLVIPAPTITTQPVAQTKYLGQSLSFSVVGKNVASYAWKKVGATTVLGTTATFTVAATATADYTVTLTNASGSVTSVAVTGTIIPAPTATVAAKQIMPVVSGTTVNLTSTVTNAGPTTPTYLWTTPTGATLCVTANCNLTNAQPSQSGTYTFKVTTPAGTASKTIAVTVLAPIVIAAGTPADQTVYAGKPYQFVVTATGSAPTYQWFKGAVAISGATGASYGEAAATAADAGSYQVNVANGLGVESRVATLTVLPLPTITIASDGALPTYETQPLMLAATAATNATTYQWKKNGVALNGATGLEFGVAATTAASAGSYTCVATNPGGSTTSNAVVVTLKPKPAITTQPVAPALYATQTLTLSVVATNAVAYQWRKGGTHIAGATAATYTKANAAAADAGSYDVVVTNPAGSVASTAVAVTVKGKPVIATLPTPVSVYETKPLGIAATVTNGVSYVWKKGGVAVAGQTSATFTKTAVAADAGNYTLEATNPAGTTVSTTSVVTVKGKSTAVITGTLAYYVGQTLTLGVTASDGVSYVWKLGTTQVATTKTYTKAALTAADAGSYTVAVTNPAGTTTSAAVTVTVTGKPTVSTITGTTALYVGQNLSLSATVTNAVTQKWQKGGVDIAGATGTTYAKTGLVAADAGSYTIVATNPAGDTKATAVNVTVTGPPTMKTQPVAQQVFATKTLTLTCAGNNAVSYKWQKGGVDIAGAVAATYTKTAVLADAGQYRCVVTNPAGSVNSNSVAVTVYGPPVITAQPVAQTVFLTQPIALSVTATGQDVSYQWRKGGVAIADADGATYTKAATAADAGNYDVVATNNAGSVTSATVAVVVDPKPTITTQPVGATVFIGDTITLSVVASGKSLTYQWKKGSTVIAGATSATYTKTATAADAGSYSVVVTNPGGSTASVAATIAVNGYPVITTQPVDTEVYLGQPFSLSVTATGVGLSYQWRKDDGNIASNATSPTFSRTAQAVHTGDYDCVVTNASGSTTSSSAAVTVYGKPVVTAQPSAVAVYATKALSLAVSVSSPGPSATTYAWTKDGVAIAAATTATFTKAAVTAADAGSYVLTATNPAGATSTTAIVVTVDGAPVVGALDDMTVFEGQPLTLTTTATGKGLTFQWTKDFQDLPGETTATYSVAAATQDDAGVYRLKVTNPAGFVSSSPAEVVVHGPPVITVDPVDATVFATKVLSLSVTATGVGLSYQWRKDGLPIDAATQASYVRTATVAHAGEYDCVVTNGAGSVTSASATVVVHGPPVATALAGETLFVGETLSLTVAADGQGLRYQWKKGSANIASATTETYTTTATLADAGDYSVVVTNDAGSVTAGPATVVVNGPPSITTPPGDTAVFAGQDLTLTVVALGEGLTYQWSHDGDLGGETAASLTRPFEMADAGDYTVTVTNPAGSVSATATVTVDGPPVITTDPASVVVFAGAPVELSVVATGKALSYQWRRHGVASDGGSEPTFGFTASLAADNDYDVVVSNPAGSVTSAVANVTVNGPPTITVDLEDTTVFATETLTLTVEAAGVGLTYQWTKDGQPIAGATSATYTTTASTADAGEYSVTVTNGAGHVTSETVTVTVDGAPVATGSGEPPPESRYEGQGLLLSCGATGVGATYQWLKDGAPLDGETASTLSITATSAADAGAYACVATNPAGSVTTPATTVTIKPARTIVTQPTGQELFATQALTLTVVASGTELTYQWLKDGDPITSATTATYSISTATLADAGQYTVVVADPSGPLVSDAAIVIVHGPPVIETPPSDTTVFATQPLDLSVTATGLELAYTWTRGGTALASTTESISVAAATGADAGHYVVVISNPAGSVTAAADVIVNAAPAITTEPADATVFAGQSADFAVTATGAELTYAWTFAGTTIADATTTDISVAASPEAAGTYQVTIANPAGSVTSRAALLTVDGPPVITADPIGADLLVGQPLALHVTATGKDLHYQWRRNGSDLAASDIAAATTPDLVIAAISAADAGWYDCVVSNPAGATPSELAIVEVLSAPRFTLHPQDSIVVLGEPLVLEADAEGGQIAYQWRKDGTPIPDATDAYYSVAAATEADLGVYDVTATNPAGTATSDPATVSVTDTSVVQAGGTGCGSCASGRTTTGVGAVDLGVALVVASALTALARRRQLSMDGLDNRHGGWRLWPARRGLVGVSAGPRTRTGMSRRSSPARAQGTPSRRRWPSRSR